jgi:hypothetical protein
MAEGKTNGGVAETLTLSEASVEKHVTAIFRKLGLRSAGTEHRRVQAVLTYVRRREHAVVVGHTPSGPRTLAQRHRCSAERNDMTALAALSTKGSKSGATPLSDRLQVAYPTVLEEIREGCRIAAEAFVVGVNGRLQGAPQ